MPFSIFTITNDSAPLSSLAWHTEVVSSFIISLCSLSPPQVQLSLSDTLKMQNWSCYPHLKSWGSQDEFRTLIRPAKPGVAWPSLQFLSHSLPHEGLCTCSVPFVTSLHLGNTSSYRSHLQHHFLGSFPNYNTSPGPRVPFLPAHVIFAIFYFFCVHTAFFAQ